MDHSDVNRPAIFIATSLLRIMSVAAFADPPPIIPEEIWPDNRGEHVQAHGGGILKIGDTYYWFGEDRGEEPRPRVAAT